MLSCQKRQPYLLDVRLLPNRTFGNLPWNSLLSKQLISRDNSFQSSYPNPLTVTPPAISVCNPCVFCWYHWKWPRGPLAEMAVQKLQLTSCILYGAAQTISTDTPASAKASQRSVNGLTGLYLIKIFNEALHCLSK